MASLPRIPGSLDYERSGDPDLQSAAICCVSSILPRFTRLVSSSPAALDKLNELANAIGNDPNFSNTVLTAMPFMTQRRLAIDINHTLSQHERNHPYSHEIFLGYNLATRNQRIPQ